MECGGGELSDSGSSGYWSWDHGNVSPAPSPSVTEVDSSPDEGLQMELEQGEELNAKKTKVGPLAGRCTFSPSPFFTALCNSYVCCAPFPAEFFQRHVQMSVARLWQGADVVRRNKKTYSGAAPGVSWTTFDLRIE